MSIPLEAVTADPRDIAEFLAALQAMMDGQRSLLPLPVANTPAQERANAELAQSMRVGQDIDPGTLIACTSGSTGTPKGAMLSAENLRASAAATAQHVRDTFGEDSAPGPWLLALPPHHIAGLQVILRSLAAGFAPTVATHLQRNVPFTAADFAADTQRLRAAHLNECLHTSLVPTQLERLIADPAGLNALNEYAAILVGGAAANPETLRKVRESGARVLTTYGSSETSGGVAYDGIPLPGARIIINSDHSPGPVHISGPMVARGYRNVDSTQAFPEPGTFATTDLGSVTNGILRIHGRADGAINSGGYKILPEDVERAIAQHITEVETATGQLLTLQGSACAVGVDHPEFGQAIAVAVASDNAPAAMDVTESVRKQLRPHVDRFLLPTHTLALPHLPLTHSGKVDRQALLELLREQP